MPHKHTRKDKDESIYELPPHQKARPLPVTAARQQRQQSNTAKPRSSSNKPDSTAEQSSLKKQKQKRKRDTNKDDAPRAFKRLMAFAQGKRPRDGLDDGNSERVGKSKKPRKALASSTGAHDSTMTPTTTGNAPTAPTIPSINPNERISDFSARVDAALPVSGLLNKTIRNGKDPLDLKVHRTRKEKKMHKLYDQWREEERVIQEKRREKMEEEEERRMEEGEEDVWAGIGGQSKGKKKKKGKGGGGPGHAKSVWETGDDDGGKDPWDEIKRKRGETRAGLNDVVQAPPEFKNKPKKILNIGGAGVEVGSVPKAAGSLRRREELEGVRNEVVASYRKLMAGKRPDLSVEASTAAT